MRTGEVNALLARLKGHWAQLPRTRSDSKLHKALVDKIHVGSAASELSFHSAAANRFQRVTCAEAAR